MLSSQLSPHPSFYPTLPEPTTSLCPDPPPTPSTHRRLSSPPLLWLQVHQRLTLASGPCLPAPLQVTSQVVPGAAAGSSPSSPAPPPPFSPVTPAPSRLFFHSLRPPRVPSLQAPPALLCLLVPRSPSPSRLSSSPKPSDSYLLRSPLLSAVGPALLLTPSHSQAFLLQALSPTIPNAHLLLSPLPVIWICTCSFPHSPFCRPWRQGRRTCACVYLCVSTSLRTGVCQCAWEFRVLLPFP